MSKKCIICGKNVEVWEPHKLKNGELYCKECLDELKEPKTLKNKIKKFFRLKKDKIILTLVLYLSMLFYNLIFFSSYQRGSSIIIEAVIEIVYIINFPILFIANSLNIQSNMIAFTVVTISTLLVLFWNYIIACELYYLYFLIIGKK